GLRAPADLAVIGFDDTEYGELATPALTTINIDAETHGRRAARTALGLDTAGLTSTPGEVGARGFAWSAPPALSGRGAAGSPAPPVWFRLARARRALAVCGAWLARAALARWWCAVPGLRAAVTSAAPGLLGPVPSLRRAVSGLLGPAACWWRCFG